MGVRQFRVGGVFKGWGGNSRLTVGPGLLQIEPGRLIAGLSKADVVRHRGQRVKVYKARLWPPWMNCAVVVSDGTQSVLGTFAAWNGRQMITTLQENGFQVDERVTLIELGYESMSF